MVGIGQEAVRCGELLILARCSRIEGENGRSESPFNYLEEGTLRMLLETSSALPKKGTRFLLENVHATLKGPIFAKLNHIVHSTQQSVQASISNPICLIHPLTGSHSSPPKHMSLRVVLGLFTQFSLSSTSLSAIKSCPPMR